MALLSIFRGTQAECSARPVSDGTLLFATDTKKIYLDKDSSRIEMSSVDDLGDYVTKEQLTTALNGKANTTHTHTQDQITGLKDALAGKASTSHSHSVASSSASGFMSAADKQKLDGIAAGANKYTLPAASSTALGGMKIGYKESGKNYSVKLDDNNQAYVTVPWTDTISKDTNTTYTLTKSGSTITLEGSDGSSTAVNDDNTTYSLGSFGITATAAELNYVDGVTSNVQTQLNNKADIGHTHLYAGSSSVGGPANSATKLATGRTIGVGTAVTSIPKSFNGESNITIPIDSVKESYLDWGGKGLSGNVSPIGMSLSDEHSANRLAFINGNALTMEYSSDGGSTYKDYGYSAADKSAFCTLLKDVPIGRTSGAYTTSSRTRITLFAQPYVYTDPKKMLINVSSSGSMNVLIEYKTGANGAMWKTYGYYALSGWSGWNDIPLVFNTLGGGSSQTNNIWYLRMTFIMTSVSSSASDKASVLGIRIFGTNDWISASLINQKGVMSSTGHLYSYDINANAVFPADVRAATFTGSLNGNATTATTASSATQLSTSAGSATQPVYFSNGKPAAIAYTIGKSVPSNAVFTNTTYSLSKNGSTITLTGSDGSTTSVTDSNTTYSLSSFGVTATAAELNYMDGVTSNVQTQLNGKAASSHSHSTATTSAAGFLRQLDGSTSNFLRGDGTWATPTATIADGSVTTAKLATDAVTAAKIATNAVTADGIAAESVGTSELASNAVTLDKLGSDVGTVAVQSSPPSDTNVKLWIQI